MDFVYIGPGSEEAARFDGLVKDRHAFVKFHSPGCGHCLAMAGNWDGLRSQPVPTQVIVIEVHADAIPHIKSECARPKHIRGYPTVMHVHPGGRKGREYSGDRTTEDLLRFIQEEFKKKGEARRKSLRERRHARRQLGGGPLRQRRKRGRSQRKRKSDSKRHRGRKSQRHRTGSRGRRKRSRRS